MDEQTKTIILKTLERAPHWVRVGLVSNDAKARVEAEEILAAMIGNALASGTAETAPE